MKMYFRAQDLNLLERLNEERLYVLNSTLIQKVSEMKRLVLVDKNLMCELVSLAETAAKEVACRNRWSPIPSNGVYSTTGFTYDTAEYRKWLRANSDTVCSKDFLKQFSFWNDLLSLPRL